MSVAYVGGRGLYNWRVVDINQPVAGAVAANPGKAVNYLRPYRGYAAIQQEQSNGSSRYNSFQLAWNSSVREWLPGWTGVYRSQKAWTTAPTIAISFPIPMTPPVCGVLRNTIPATLVVVNFLYALPFFKNQNQVDGKLLGGWQLSGNVQFQSGVPCGIGTGNDSANVGEVGSFGCGSEGQFYTHERDSKVVEAFCGIPRAHRQVVLNNKSGWLNTSLRLRPQIPSSTSPDMRDSVYQPGFQNWNLNMKKNFPINGENRLRVQGGCLQLHQSSQLGGSKLEPNGRHVWRSHLKNHQQPPSIAGWPDLPVLACEGSNVVFGAPGPLLLGTRQSANLNSSLSIHGENGCPRSRSWDRG